MLNALTTILAIAISHPIITLFSVVLVAKLIKWIIEKVSDSADGIDKLINGNKVPDDGAKIRRKNIIESEYRCPACGVIYGKLYDKKSNGPYSHKFGYRCMNCYYTWDGNLFNWNYKPTKRWRLKKLDRDEPGLYGYVQDVLLEEDRYWNEEIPEACEKKNDGCFYKEIEGKVLYKEIVKNGKRISNQIRIERIRESGPVEYFETNDGYSIYIDKNGEYRHASSGLPLESYEENEYMRSGYLNYSNTPGYARQQQYEEEERQRREREWQEEEEREREDIWFYF